MKAIGNSISKCVLRIHHLYNYVL
ncbi:hypothetical protein V12B01_13060 [Vibrio splendidus 12B01]|nr:hypothetical protein V12B01_13060 [Vibrio splendidus 12B01]